MNIRGKTALVTGGAARLGKAICEALARAGCDVVIHYNSSFKQAVELKKSLEKAGVRAFLAQGYLGSKKVCEMVDDGALRKAGRLDILVNNAAVYRKQPMLLASEKEIRRELDVNLLAPLWLTRAFAARVSKGGVVNMLDRRITTNEPGMLPYMLSKKGLADFTRLAAMELAPSIAVNAVAPGPVIAPRVGSSVREKKGYLPLGRRPSVEDVAKAALFLLESDSITGQIVCVDGGQHLLGSGV